MTTETLKKTPLHDVHVSLGAKMVPFAGFEMPVTYPSGINSEHRAVREDVGVFDVSHTRTRLLPAACTTPDRRCSTGGR